MNFASLWRSWLSRSPARPPGYPPASRCRPRLEELEPRHLLTAARGIYAVGPPNVPMPSAVFSDPYVDGILLRATWDSLEPADGVYNWSYLDSQIAAAAATGKQVALSIVPGIHTPSWVYAEGAAAFAFVDDSSPAPMVIPVPWDPVFLGRWQTFVHALGARYEDNPAVVQVKITGVNRTGEETSLPYALGQSVTRGTMTWTTTSDVLHWAVLGYTRTRVEQAWWTIADTFEQAFPTKFLALLTVPQAFPPLDANGNLIPNYLYDPQIAHDLIQQGVGFFGPRLIVQNDGLSTYWIDPASTAEANTVTTGYQTLWFCTGDSTYLMNNGVPIDPRTEFQVAVTRGLAGGARFLELYLQDILNPGLQDILASAQAYLRAEPSPFETPALNFLTEGYLYAYDDWVYGSHSQDAYLAYLFGSYAQSYAQLAASTHSPTYWFDAYAYANEAYRYALQDYQATGDSYADGAFVWDSNGLFFAYSAVAYSLG